MFFILLLHKGPDSAAGNTGGVVAGVIVALLVVGVIAVVTIVIVVWLVKKRQGKTLIYSVTKTGTFGANSTQCGGFGKLNFYY